MENCYTLDTNPTHGLALVMHGTPDNLSEARFELVSLDKAPPAHEGNPIASVYIRQAHYIVSHVARGLAVYDLNVPKDGWAHK